MASTKTFPPLVPITHPGFAFENNPCLLLSAAEPTPCACLEALLSATDDLGALIREHPDIDEDEPWFGWAFQLPGRTLLEAELFPRTAAEEDLRPLIATYVRRVIDLFRETGGEPGLYVNEELEAGSKAIESLVIANPPEYLPLYLEYLEAIDLEHTVEQHSVVMRIRVRLNDDQCNEIKQTLGRLSGGENFPDF